MFSSAILMLPDRLHNARTHQERPESKDLSFKIYFIGAQEAQNEPTQRF